MTKRHAGIFQCFVYNSLTRVDGGAATLEVIPRSKVFQPLHVSTPVKDLDEDLTDEEEEDFDLDEFLDTGLTSAPVKPPPKGKGKKNKLRPKGISTPLFLENLHQLVI